MIKLTTCYLWLLLISLLYCMVILFFLFLCYSFLTGHSEERCPWYWLKCVFHLEKVAVVLCTLYRMERFYSETCTFTEFRKEMPPCLHLINSWKDIELVAHDLHLVIKILERTSTSSPTKCLAIDWDCITYGC